MGSWLKNSVQYKFTKFVTKSRDQITYELDFSFWERLLYSGIVCFFVKKIVVLSNEVMTKGHNSKIFSCLLSFYYCYRNLFLSILWAFSCKMTFFVFSCMIDATSSVSDEQPLTPPGGEHLTKRPRIGTTCMQDLDATFTFNLWFLTTLDRNRKASKSSNETCSSCTNISWKILP